MSESVIEKFDLNTLFNVLSEAKSFADIKPEFKEFVTECHYTFPDKDEKEPNLEAEEIEYRKQMAASFDAIINALKLPMEQIDALSYALEILASDCRTDINISLFQADIFNKAMEKISALPKDQKFTATEKVLHALESGLNLDEQITAQLARKMLEHYPDVPKEKYEAACRLFQLTNHLPKETVESLFQDIKTDIIAFPPEKQYQEAMTFLTELALDDEQNNIIGELAYDAALKTSPVSQRKEKANEAIGWIRDPELKAELSSELEQITDEREEPMYADEFVRKIHGLQIGTLEL